MYLLCFVLTNEIDTRIDTRLSFAPQKGTKQAIPSPCTTTASDKYSFAAPARTLSFGCPLVGLHRYPARHHLPCTAGSSNPGILLAALIARCRSCTALSSKSHLI